MVMLPGPPVKNNWGTRRERERVEEKKKFNIGRVEEILLESRHAVLRGWSRSLLRGRQNHEGSGETE